MPQKKKNAIPDRWCDYKSVGKRIPGTRFIAFKVPLKQSLLRRVSESEGFGSVHLMDVLKREGEELGLIIDLTFTKRYYQPQDLPDSLHYVKIFTAGHEVPSDSTILNFKRTVRRFLRENHNNEKLIGVHCTHGLNRTGYLVCRYLIDVDGVEPQHAIDLFNRSRGHEIERQNYIQDLTSGPKRSNDGMEDSLEEEPIQGGTTNSTRSTQQDLYRGARPRPDVGMRGVSQDGSFHHLRRNHPAGPRPPPLPPYMSPSLMGPPPLLPIPPTQGAWSGFSDGHYPAPPLNPQYQFRKAQRHTRRRNHHRRDHTHTSPYTH